MYSLARGDISSQGTHILSTEGMIRRVQQSPANEFVVATETGVLHRMGKVAPQKTFYPISEETICRYMKMITLSKVVNSLRHMVHQVTVPEPIAQRARVAIERMLALA
jgi:quinolinate synthase